MAKTQVMLKVETPPPEDEHPVSTSPDPVATELRQLEKDIQASSELLSWLNSLKDTQTRTKRDTKVWSLRFRDSFKNTSSAF